MIKTWELSKVQFCISSYTVAQIKNIGKFRAIGLNPLHSVE